MAKYMLSLPNRDPVLFAGLVAAAMLAGAFAFQYAGYAPCEMCWWQRYPYFAVVALALVAKAVRALPTSLVIAALALLFAVDASLALFHVGVEQKWWEGFTSCTAAVDFSGDMDATLDAIMNAPIVRCDEIAWSLFGISMAGYNFIIATAMTVFLASNLRKA
ncbi:disulfide bond formation protein B [Kordiimonas gwangyangensis]|uniref:disulfide bond formation protein B n=1 Tax=Kordiimonas gwangyangensis TaxID=288022 RepID=UPI00036C41A0|nr:disulfide bond formation protein B [Kordiimonas gwangyangensis]